MITNISRSINDLLYNGVNHVLRYGDDIVVRGQKVKELGPIVFTITQPTKRTLLYPYRGNNPFASLFETLWVLASPNNNIAALKKFIPNAVMFSDDGETWRAGYPERLRMYGHNKTNQIRYVYETLKADRNSRQAVINLWDATVDCFNEYDELLQTKDRPCSQNLTFSIRDGKLNVLFYIRSNDAIWGLSAINFYEFTTLQEILASALNVKVGKFTYVINNLHIYERHMDKAEKLTNEENYNMVIDAENHYGHDMGIFEFVKPKSGTPYHEIEYELYRLYRRVVDRTDYKPFIIKNTVDGQFRFIHYCLSFFIDNAPDWNKKTPKQYVEEFSKTTRELGGDTDLRLAMLFWLYKKLELIKPNELDKVIELEM